MAMYIFQEIEPKVFYFTYSLQETQKYVSYLEESENDKTDKNLIQKWQPFYNLEDSIEDPGLAGYQKFLTSDFSNHNGPVDTRTLYLINTLKATFHWCFKQYKIFNNIEEEVNLCPKYILRKYNSGKQIKEISHSKYTAYFFLNDDYVGGDIKFKNSTLRPEAGSLIILPKDNEIVSSELDGQRYVAIGEWQ
jgi:hypothetical protein